MELVGKEEDQDRISQLPDSILHHILSEQSWETKHVMRTCVLSKRWRKVWRSMPNLFFCNDRRYTAIEELTIPYNSADFPAFVNMVLLRRDTLDVHSLRIRWFNAIEEHEPQHIITWVQYAVNHNVKKLELTLEFYTYDLILRFTAYELPSCVFTCPTLEDLKLSVIDWHANLPKVVCLGRLRKLHLHHFVSIPILLNSVISGCPVLEDLHFEECLLQDPDISSYSIKKLDFERCVFEGTRIRISIRSLQFLDISGNAIQGLKVLLENLTSLVEASFQTENYDACHYADFDQGLVKFTGPRTTVASGEMLSELQSFNKLQRITLHGWRMVESFPTVAHFLLHSPNLELLTLVQERMDSFPTWKKWFVCSHRKICVVSKCGVENARIFELLTVFSKSRCCCFRG